MRKKVFFIVLRYCSSEIINRTLTKLWLLCIKQHEFCSNNYKRKGSVDNTYVSVQNSLIFNMVKIIFKFLEVFTHGYRANKWGRVRVYRFTNRDCNFID
jgi:hypothetical protein